jgi:SAM-dependent methyltransferase
MCSARGTSTRSTSIRRWWSWPGRVSRRTGHGSGSGRATPSTSTPDATYDAVFDFAIVHHVPDWRGALSEVARVLKPGGRFYSEEVLRALIHHPLWRRLLEHPMHDRFDAKEFADGLESVGLRVAARRELLDQIAWFVAKKA